MSVDIAILVVNGGRDPPEKKWIGLCIESVEKYSDSSRYRLYVWNNNTADTAVTAWLAGKPHVRLFQAEPGERLQHFHAIPLQRLYEAARADGMHYIVTLDSDAHPVRAGWLEVLTRGIDDGHVLAGIWRDELAPGIQPYLHASCLCTTVAFVERQGLRFDNVCEPDVTGAQDTLADFSNSAVATGSTMLKLHRSNRRNFHKLMGGVYGGLVYHHGAGSRVLISFWSEEDTRYNRLMNTILARESARMLMSEGEQYLKWLEGERVEKSFAKRIAPLERLSAQPRSLRSRARVAMEAIRLRLPQWLIPRWFFRQ